MSATLTPIGAAVRRMAIGDVIEIEANDHAKAVSCARRVNYFISIIGRRNGKLCLKRLEHARWGVKKRKLCGLAIGDSFIEPDVLKQSSWEHLAKYYRVKIWIQQTPEGLKITRTA